MRLVMERKSIEKAMANKTIDVRREGGLWNVMIEGERRAFGDGRNVRFCRSRGSHA
jgi:hypothetical protein